METVQVPKYHFKNRVKHQYGQLVMAILRELIQNSRDAGAKNIWFEFEDGKYTCRDDGHGMTEREFRDYYLNLGGTLKKTDSIGGFGAAKELTFAADTWSVIGNGFICTGEGCHYTISSFIPQEGFVIQASDTTYQKSRFQYTLRELCNGSFLPLTIWMNGEQVKQGRKLHHSHLLWDFGFARLYSPRRIDSNDGNTGYKYIRTKGLLTKTEYTGGDYLYYLEIDNPLEILTENREAIREEYALRITQEIEALKKQGLDRKPEMKQITLYGIPKERSYARNGFSNGHGLGFNSAGEIVAAYQEVDYESEVGNYPTAGSNEPLYDGPTYKSDPEYKSPDNGFVNEIDTEALAEITSTQTTLGMLKFAHKQLQHWTYPFAIIEDGKRAIQIFTKDNKLTDKAKKALTIALTVNKMLADDLAIRCPIPALLFSTGENGVCATTGPYELIGYDPDILVGERELEGTPFGVLELAMHEVAHHWQSEHGQSYESQRMHIARTIGKRVEIYLTVIKGLQKGITQ